jgi:signal transduction histidine kinase
VIDELPREWTRPAPDARGIRADAIVAVALAALGAASAVLYSMVGFLDDVRADWWVSALVIAGATLPLVVRRRHPEIAGIVVSAAFIAGQALYVPEVLAIQIALFLAIYSIGGWSRSRRRSIAARIAIIVVMFGWLFISLVRQVAFPELLPDYDPDQPTSTYVATGLISLILNLLYFGAAYVFGERSWASAREHAALTQRTAQLAAERERTSRQAVALERVRIARELHDVVAHHVSVMGVQAGAARRVLTRDPAKAEQALSAVESNAREAVDELHRMLTTLRDEGAEPADPATAGPSTRGVAQLPDLVAEVAATGRPISAETIGAPRALTPVVDLSLHRIAQEALTNALKHSPADAPIDVRLRYLDDAAEIEVVTGTGTRARPTSPGAGLGHIGMRERVAAIGGTVEIGPRRAGGYLVRATLPTARADAGVAS